MPPKSTATQSLASTSKCRRSERLIRRIKSVVKGQSTSSKKEQPSPTKKRRRPAYSKKSAVKGQSASSNKEESTVTENKPSKRIRLMEMGEVTDRASKMGQKEQENFSTAIKQILKDLSPDLQISKEAIDDMNIFLNHVFEQLARASAIFPLGKSTVSTLRMTVKDIETALPSVIPGELGKYCIAEGRRAVRKWTEGE
ncbi:uncharacterized protein LOC129959255 [Argiope bruennichi]|uniref:Histone H2B.1 like protein n=1 Tax=Argiope bruennichi TaxID=94029 RepID=A0A8T0F6K3_ARGBR|nr:uncharacterized protein LOC129959255 [Argiope bruennichi]KAF8785049.1 Histone H2B.1 like protein [Argiope bruennichi]